MRFLLLAFLAWPVFAAGHPADFDDEHSRQELAAGRVPVHAAVDDGKHGGQVLAAVIIHARAETVWRVMRDCEKAPSYVPGLRRCHRISAAEDGSWEIIEHEMKYSWLMPPIRSILRLDYHLSPGGTPSQIDFHRLSGDLKREEGLWRVQTVEDGGTLVEYQVRIEPGFWVPAAIVRASLRHQLPEALLALRQRVESIEARLLASADKP